jgi:parvulin-like peptidyl-prolyl isomerase
VFGCLFGIGYGIAALIVSGIISTQISNSADIKKAAIEVNRDYSSAQIKLQGIEERWNREASDNEFRKKISELERVKNDYMNLNSKRDKQLQVLNQERRKHQLEKFLDQYPLYNAQIDGVGSGRKTTLESYGIQTAVDIEKYEAGQTTSGESYDVRHILFDTRGKTDEEKQAIKAKAQGVLDRVKNGEDFASLAKEFTEDTGSKENGGLYTGVGKGDFVSEVEGAALSLKVGEIYPDLVESMFGYHIIKLEGHKNTLSTQEAEEVINKEFEEISKGWVESANVELGSQYYSIGLEESTSGEQKTASDGTTTSNEQATSSEQGNVADNAVSSEG